LHITSITRIATAAFLLASLHRSTFGTVSPSATISTTIFTQAGQKRWLSSTHPFR
jgi:hypothetical protein